MYCVNETKINLYGSKNSKINKEDYIRLAFEIRRCENITSNFDKNGYPMPIPEGGHKICKSD